jgi:pimeloyl-ACP methyl ester carboxylesterase
MRSRLLLLALLAILAVLPASAAAAPVPTGADWSEATIQSSDGVKLHADILRPEGLVADAQTPVILSLGPYFNHSGQTGPAGPVEDTSYDPVGPSEGPSDRFLDFVEGAKLMERGYTFVMVDLRGFGGSSGCLDWAGPGEQGDVVSAVQWAASQPWSTGRVGMYGTSYDGVTGLIGVNHAPSGEKKLDLWSADWKIAAGHRIAVRVTDANEDWWIHTPLFDTVQVMGGSVTLPFLTYQRTDTIQGDPGTQLDDYLSETITVPPETMRDSVSSSFQLPPPQQPRP